MADENKDQVTNSELDAAANEGIAKGKQDKEEVKDKGSEEDKVKAELEDAEKKKQETEAKLKEEKEKKEFEDEPAERSRLGRKVKGLEAERVTLINDISDLKQKMDQLLSKNGSQDGGVVTNEEDDTPISRKELPALFQREREKENKFKTTKEAEFHQGVYEVSNEETDNELVTEILAEMDNDKELLTYEFVNPKGSAKTNFLTAKSRVLERKLNEFKTGKKNPLDKNRETADEKIATGVTGGDRVQTRKVTIPDLDDEAKAFLKYAGLKDEEVSEALTGNSNSLVIKGKGRE